MHTLALEWQAIWKILLTSLAFGAGLPALFAFGIRALAYGTDGASDDAPAVAHPAGRVVAYLCFGLVLLVVALGIAMIVASGFGKAMDFSGGLPVLRDK